MVLLAIAMFLVSPGSAWTPPTFAQMGPALSPDKKIIGWASDRVDQVYFSEHYEELERLRPLDGMCISLYPDEWDGLVGHRNRRWFGAAKYSVADFTDGIARLKTCNFKRFTDNFFDFPTTVFGQRKADWFDEDWDDVVLNNIVVAAKIAREVGFKGLYIDTEGYHYGAGLWRKPFNYGAYVKECSRAGLTPRSLQECRAQVRARGREVGRAVTQAYPDIVLFFIAGFPMYDQGQEMLIVPFVDGILESAGPQVTIWNGGEIGYPRMLLSSFRKLREDAHRFGKQQSAVPDVFEKRMRYGFGVWVDAFARLYGGFHTDDLSKNHKDGPGLEHTLYNALTFSDRYVWLYVWHPALWWTPTQDPAPMPPGTKVPTPYLQAILNCRKPHDLNWTPLKKDNRKYGPASEWPDYDSESTFAEFEKDYVLVKDFTAEKWQFHLDPELPMGYVDMKVDDSRFTPIRIGEFWENQGHPYDGIGWYRLWFTVPETLNGRSLAGRRFVLVYGGVAGSACTWIWAEGIDDDDKVSGYPHGTNYPIDGKMWLRVELYRQNLNDYEQKNMARRFQRDADMIIRPGKRHLMVIRVNNTKGPGGIWKPLKLYVPKKREDY